MKKRSKVSSKSLLFFVEKIDTIVYILTNSATKLSKNKGVSDKMNDYFQGINQVQ